MTREEAIKHLLEMKDGMPFDKCRDWREAVTIAIKSIIALRKIDVLVNKTYWAYPIGIDYCLDALEDILKEVEEVNHECTEL